MPTAIGSYATASALKTRAGISDSTDDTLLGTICDQVNAYIERETKRVMAPINSATYLYDGDGTSELYLPITGDGSKIGGIRAITLLEVKPYTGGTFQTVTSGEYFLRDKVHVAGPYEKLVLSDRRTSGFGYFPRGYETVRVTGTAGWAAIPDDITEVALVAAVRAWHAREAGQTDIVGTDEFGKPVISRFFSVRDYATLMDFAITDVLVSG
jgi:hypothetical protein